MFNSLINASFFDCSLFFVNNTDEVFMVTEYRRENTNFYYGKNCVEFLKDYGGFYFKDIEEEIIYQDDELKVYILRY